MQYIKRFLSYAFFGSSGNKGIDLKEFKKIDETPIGTSTFGLVYRVKKDDEYYAAKVLKPLTIDQKSYTKEIENFLNIQHPAILSFEGYSLTDFSGESNPIILSKYFDNVSLRHALDQEQKAQALINWDNTHKYIILYGVAEGMKFLHEKGFIHCNLNPENILLNNSYFPLICDYGLSKLYDQNELISFANDNEKIVYMAPEFLLGKKYDNSIDVYSYGLIMFEIVTGEKLYSKKMSRFELISKIEKDYRPQFPECFTINDKIIELIKRCWSDEISLRPSFEEIIEILEDEEIFSWFEVDDVDFSMYSSLFHNENDDTSSKIGNQCIKERSENTLMRKDTDDEPITISIYPESKLVLLDENCQNLVKLAESGDSSMMVTVADNLFKGSQGFPNDIEIGLKYLKHAIEMNNIEASEMYASMLIKGDLISKNIEEAGQIVENLIQINSPNSKKLWVEIELTKSKPDYWKIQNYIGEMISKGNTEVSVMYAKFCLMKKEETQNDHNENINEARKYFKIAADLGNLEAKKLLSDLLKEEYEKREKERMEERVRNEGKGDIEHFKMLREKRNICFQRCNLNSKSFVDSLRSIGADSSFQNRIKIASQNGIPNYTGSANQNIYLLSLLKQGLLERP